MKKSRHSLTPAWIVAGLLATLPFTSATAEEAPADISWTVVLKPGGKGVAVTGVVPNAKAADVGRWTAGMIASARLAMVPSEQDLVFRYTAPVDHSPREVSARDPVFHRGREDPHRGMRTRPEVPTAAAGSGDITHSCRPQQPICQAMHHRSTMTTHLSAVLLAAALAIPCAAASKPRDPSVGMCTRKDEFLAKLQKWLPDHVGGK